MKSARSIAFFLTVAAVSGSGGYFIGKSRSDRSGSAHETISPTAPRTLGRPAVESIDPVRLRSALDAEKNPLARFKLAQRNLEAWIGANPRDALDWLTSQPVTARRGEVIRMALKQYSETDAKGAADWALAHLDGAELNNTLITIARDWAIQSGGEAAGFFLTLPTTRERDAALEQIFFSWSSNEPEAALAFLASQTGTGDLSPVLRRAALAGWAKSDPHAAVAASLDMSRSAGDPSQFANTLANWGTMDLEGSSQWLLTQVPAGTERTAAASELAGIFARQSPEAGIEWLNKLSPGAERDGAASTLAADWSRDAPADAAAWAASQAAGNLSPRALAALTRNFFMKDATAFEAWRASLPEGPLKQQAARAGAMEEE